MDEQVARLIALKRAVYEADPHRMYPYLPPGPPAAPADLLALEQHLNMPLPPTFRSFLERHDGWPQFVLDIDLLTCRQMIDSPQLAFARQSLKLTRDIVGSEYEQVALDDAFIVGVSVQSRDLLLLNPLRRSPEGECELIWWHDGPISRDPDFLVFLSETERLLRDHLADLKQR